MADASVLERQMLDLINAERAKAGLDPLRLELRLNDSSETHSEWMLQTDVFSHTGAGGSSAGDRMKDAGFVFSGSWTWGENIALQSERGAAGLADDVEDLHTSLMNSAGHRANILNPNFEVLGVGIERGEYKGYDVVIVTQNFARSSAPMQYDGGGSTYDAPVVVADPEPIFEPEPNAAPVVQVADLTLPAQDWTGIANRVSFSDADGDQAVGFEIRDVNGGQTVKVGGQVVDASSGYVFSAAALASLELRAGTPGSSETLQIRAHDGTEWGDWDSFVLAAEAEQDKPFALVVDDFVLKPGETASVADHVTAEGGDPIYFQVLDRGDDNFGLGSRTFSADWGRWLTADQFDDLWLRGDAHEGEQSLGIRAYQSGEFTDWEFFTLTTDWDALS